MENVGQERREGMNILTEKIATLHTDVTDIKHSIKDLTMAINKLAVVEERLSNSNASLDRLYKLHTRLDARIDELEKKSQSIGTSAKWIDRSLVAIIGAFCVFVWEKITK